MGLGPGYHLAPYQFSESVAGLHSPCHAERFPITILLSVCMNLTISNSSYKWKYAIFVLPLRIISSRFTHIEEFPSFFKAEQQSIVCGYHVFFVHLFVS